MARRLVNRHLKKRFLKRRFRHCAYIHWVDLQEERSNVYQRYYHVHTLVRVSTTENWGTKIGLQLLDWWSSDFREGSMRIDVYDPDKGGAAYCHDHHQEMDLGVLCDGKSPCKRKCQAGREKWSALA